MLPVGPVIDLCSDKGTYNHNACCQKIKQLEVVVQQLQKANTLLRQEYHNLEIKYRASENQLHEIKKQMSTIVSICDKVVGQSLVNPNQIQISQPLPALIPSHSPCQHAYVQQATQPINYNGNTNRVNIASSANNNNQNRSSHPIDPNCNRVSLIAAKRVRQKKSNTTNSANSNRNSNSRSLPVVDRINICDISDDDQNENENSENEHENSNCSTTVLTSIESNCNYESSCNEQSVSNSNCNSNCNSISFNHNNIDSVSSNSNGSISCSKKCNDGFAIKRTSKLRILKTKIDKFYQKYIPVEYDIQFEFEEKSKVKETYRQSIVDFLTQNANYDTDYYNCERNSYMQVYKIKNKLPIPPLVGQKGLRAKKDIPENFILGRYIGNEYLEQEFEKKHRKHKEKWYVANLRNFQADFLDPDGKPFNSAHGKENCHPSSLLSDISDSESSTDVDSDNASSPTLVSQTIGHKKGKKRRFSDIDGFSDGSESSIGSNVSNASNGSSVETIASSESVSIITPPPRKRRRTLGNSNSKRNNKQREKKKDKEKEKEKGKERKKIQKEIDWKKIQDLKRKHQYIIIDTHILDDGSRHMLSYMNDCRKDMSKPKTRADDKRHNVCYLGCEVNSWPMIFAITSQKVKKGTPLYCLYGEEFWNAELQYRNFIKNKNKGKNLTKK